MYKPRPIARRKNVQIVLKSHTYIFNRTAKTCKTLSYTLAQRESRRGKTDAVEFSFSYCGCENIGKRRRKILPEFLCGCVNILKVDKGFWQLWGICSLLKYRTMRSMIDRQFQSGKLKFRGKWLPCIVAPTPQIFSLAWCRPSWIEQNYN